MGRAIEFETADLAREKGYGERCYRAYSVWRGKIRKGDINPLESIQIEYEPWGQGSFSEVRRFYQSKQHTLAPDQADLQRWLREEHNINVESNYLPNIQKYRALSIPMDIIPKSFKTYWLYHKAISKYHSIIDCDTYEDALEIGLLEALKLIK